MLLTLQNIAFLVRYTWYLLFSSVVNKKLILFLFTVFFYFWKINDENFQGLEWRMNILHVDHLCIHSDLWESYTLGIFPCIDLFVHTTHYPWILVIFNISPYFEGCWQKDIIISLHIPFSPLYHLIVFLFDMMPNFHATNL